MRRRGRAGPGRKQPAPSTSVAATFRKFDVYPKLQEDFQVKTQSGAMGAWWLWLHGTSGDGRATFDQLMKHRLTWCSGVTCWLSVAYWVTLCCHGAYSVAHHWRVDVPAVLF